MFGLKVNEHVLEAATKVTTEFTPIAEATSSPILPVKCPVVPEGEGLITLLICRVRVCRSVPSANSPASVSSLLLQVHAFVKKFPVELI